MHIFERQSGDVIQLRSLARKQHNAEQRDRLRVVILAIQGLETEQIQHHVDRSRGFVQRWAYAYRDGGIAALQAKPKPGRSPRLPREREAELSARLDAGVTSEDRVCTLRGKDIQRILEQSFGVRYSLNGVYDLLDRLGYSSLAPRPRHEQNDPKVIEEFQRRAPLLCTP
jgi:transposase